MSRTIRLEHTTDAQLRAEQQAFRERKAKAERRERREQRQYTQSTSEWLASMPSTGGTWGGTR